MQDMRKERRISFIILQLAQASGQRHTCECIFKAAEAAAREAHGAAFRPLIINTEGLRAEKDT